VNNVQRIKQRHRFLSLANPVRILVLGYLVITLTGALLLSLPVASESGRGQPILDALFMASSGISTTGLAVVDIGKTYTLFGELVMLLVFQVGGSGYMAFMISIPFLLGRKNSIGMNVLARESMASPGHWNLGPFFLSVILYTLFCELAGMIILGIRWIPLYGVGRALYLGLFHSVSAFCTAGFSLFPDSLMGYVTDPVVNATIILSSILGGLGYVVVYNIYHWVIMRLQGKRGMKLDFHSKVVFLMSLLLFSGGALLILFSEKWPAEYSWGERAMISLFQSVSASTTDGYNSLDTGKMALPGLVGFLILMFVGAAPGSTGGGIKNTTFAVLLGFVWNQLRGRSKNLVMGKREIPDDTYLKSSGIFFWFVLIISLVLVVMAFTEKCGIFMVLFEIISALGNAGLSMGITSSLSPVGKFLLVVVMFVGRVGPLTFGLALIRQNPVKLYRYPSGDIHVG